MTPTEEARALQRAALLGYLEEALDTGTVRVDALIQIGLEVHPLRTVLAALADDPAVVPAWICNEIGQVYGMTYGELVVWIETRLEA